MCTPSRSRQRRTRLFTVVVASLTCVPAAFAQHSPVAFAKAAPVDITPRIQTFQCGDFTGHFGPLDFRSADPRDKQNVESNHFEMELSSFLMGRVEGRNRAGTGTVAGGFQYTLKAFPNHPVALKVMEELGRKLKSEQPQGTMYPLECWYVRAFKIAPDDPMVRALYGIYLAYRDRSEEARHNLDIADPELQYSRAMQYMMGEARFQLKQYEKAQLNAMRAARLGFPGDVLQKALQDGGHWNAQLPMPPDPPEVTSDASTASTAASATAR